MACVGCEATIEETSDSENEFTITSKSLTNNTKPA